MTTPALIMLVEDDAALAALLQEQLAAPRLRIVHCQSGHAALAWLQEHRPDLMLLDYTLTDMTGSDLLEALDRGRRTPPFIVISGHNDASVAVAMMKEGAQDYLIKDLHIVEQVKTVVPRVLHKLETEHRLAAAEHALARSQQRHLAMLSAIPDTIVRLDPEGSILDLRPGHHPSRPLTALSATPHHLRDLLPGATTTELLRASRSMLDTGRSVPPLEFQLPGNGGSHFEARLATAGEGEIILLVRDITERARLEQLKMDFVQRAAHELRTPLATVGLMVDLLQQGGSQAEVAQFWDVLKAELVRQQILVDELLSAGRLEDGRLALRTGPVPLHDLLEQVLQALGPLLRAGQLHLECDCPGDLPPLHGDRVYLHQILINLLTNAAKFTAPGGTVSVRAWCPSARELACAIRDTGIGIPPVEVARLGERFFRASNAVCNEIPGSGIGLYIVHALVARHGGRLHCESELGEGTTMTLFLPTSAASQP